MARNIDREAVRGWLEAQFAMYHHPRWIGSDPVQFLHRYDDPLDQEITGLIASSLAYGNVLTINRSVAEVMSRMDEKPRRFLVDLTPARIRRAMSGFRHRWTSDLAMSVLLIGIKDILATKRSLGAAFVYWRQRSGNPRAALAAWVRQLQDGHSRGSKKLLADPEQNSACKRLHLYMRWMARSDCIDPGCWPGVDVRELMMPVDTHVYRFARVAGFTRRGTVDVKTVAEITEAFRQVSPEDPVKYDFSLTRPGIIEKWKPETYF